jgi:predicted TIM-barrel fold metal-dependent hydrolase
MAVATQYRFPDPIAAFAGQIYDVDSHECVPINHWAEEFGSVVGDFVSAIQNSEMKIKAEKERDDAEINSENVWKLKLEKAPGAFDFKRRLDVLDFTGVKLQLMYPGGMGLNSVALYNSSDDKSLFKTLDVGDRKAYARKLHRAYNDWCVRIYRSTNRLRPVAILIADTPEELIAEAKRLVGQGVRGLWVPTDRPPGGVSPAHPLLDPLWSLLSAAESPLLAHIGAEQGFLKTLEWRNAPAFEGFRVGGEFSLDPWTLSGMHMTVQNFLTTMVLGGVFERHPKLRFGSAEFTGHWLGPAAENMDCWYDHQPFGYESKNKKLKLKPSEYIRRNVRVACFDFEPVGRYIERFGFEEVYCYASDFPHHEGGKDPLGHFTESLRGFSPEVLRKFFVENGKLLLP